VHLFIFAIIAEANIIPDKVFPDLGQGRIGSAIDLASGQLLREMNGFGAELR